MRLFEDELDLSPASSVSSKVLGLGVFVAPAVLVLCFGRESSDLSPAVFSLILGALIVVGLFIAFLRIEHRLDRRLGQVTRRVSWLVPLWTTVREIHGGEPVHLEEQVRRMSRERRRAADNRFLVRLASDEGLFTVRATSDYQVARQAAEHIANFLGTGILDAAGGVEVHRASAELDATLRKQMGRKATAEPAPTTLPFPFDPTARGFEAHLPPPDVRAATSLLAFAGILIALAIVGAILGSLIALFLLPVTVLGLVAAAYGRHVSRSLVETLIVTADEIAVEFLIPLPFCKMQRSACRLEEIEELFIAERGIGPRQKLPVILVRSDDATLQFGSGLTASERESLVTVLRRVCDEGVGFLGVRADARLGNGSRHTVRGRAS